MEQEEGLPPRIAPDVVVTKVALDKLARLQREVESFNMVVTGISVMFDEGGIETTTIECKRVMKPHEVG